MSRNRVLAVVATLCIVLLAFFLLRDGAQAVAGGEGKPRETAASTPASGRGRPAALAREGEDSKAVKAPTEEGRVYARGAWGSGPDQFGRYNMPESSPEGPLSISVDSQGTTYVLDQVNGRILRFDKDGKPLEPFKVTQQTPQDVIPTSFGTTLVMDPTQDRSIAVLDKSGNLLGELPMTGKHLEEKESGLATGVFADSEGVYVEKAHAKTFRVGDAAGNPDPDQPLLLDGRPGRDGTSLLSMGLVQARDGRFWVRSMDRRTGQLKFMREYTLPTPIMTLVFLDSDPSGRIYAAAHVGRERSSDPADGGYLGFDEQSVQLLCLEPSGKPRKVLALPANTMAEQSVRDLAVRDDGSILYMLRSQEGMEILKYSCD